METWNDICNSLTKCREQGVSEEEYHDTIEALLSEFLGWKRLKNEVCHKERIPSGHSTVEPDIILKKDGVVQMVIEVKKPNHMEKHEDCIRQLSTYMRLCKLRVGIYMGECIEIVFDSLDDSINSLSVCKSIKFERNSQDGEKFVELMMRDNFTKEAMVSFCNDMIKEQQTRLALNNLREDLIKGRYDEQIVGVMKEFLLNDNDLSFTEDQIDEILASVLFKVLPKNIDVKQEMQEIPIVQSQPGFKREANGKDKTKYSLEDGKFLPKNRFALAVVRKYVRLHPEKTFEELTRVFHEDWPSNLKGVVKEITQITDKEKKDQRYFTKGSDVIFQSADNKYYAVCSQWDKDTIKKMVHFAESQGWKVEASE